MKNDITRSEQDLVSFDGANLEGKRPTARFRVAARNIEGGAILDKDGNLQNLYHVKASDLQKRRRKLLRQGVDPSETDRAIDVLLSLGIKEAGPRHRYPPPRRP